MKLRLVTSILFVFLAFTFITCRQTKELIPSKVRSLNTSEVSSYHQPIQMTVAWVPYQKQKLVKTKKGEWQVVKNDETDAKGNVPVILVTYPASQDTIWIDMNTDTELLGQLVKHSLMTQEPIRRPYTEFFEVASCQKCHPAHVEADFN